MEPIKNTPEDQIDLDIKNFYHQASFLEKNHLKMSNEDKMSELKQFKELYDACKKPFVPLAKIEASNEIKSQNNSTEMIGAFGITTLIALITLMTTMAMSLGLPIIILSTIGASLLSFTAVSLITGNKPNSSDNQINEQDLKINTDVLLDDLFKQYRKEIIKCYDDIIILINDATINVNDASSVIVEKEYLHDKTSNKEYKKF